MQQFSNRFLLHHKNKYDPKLQLLSRERYRPYPLTLDNLADKLILDWFKSFKLMEKKTEVISYLDNISLFLVGLLLLLFPLFVNTLTTDTFILPKQALLIGVSIISLILFLAKMIADGAIRIKRTPFDLPVILFISAILVSSAFATNRVDSFIVAAPILFAAIIYFTIVNIQYDKKSLLFLVIALTIGALVTSLVSLLSFFKIYPLPFLFTHSQTFSFLGSLLDQAIYLALVLPLSIYFILKLTHKAENDNTDQLGSTIRKLTFSLPVLIIAIALSLTIYMFLAPPPGGPKPIILPFETGFQTGFAAISQDPSKIAHGFITGSGYGTYLTDFTRFKEPRFNQNSELWNFTFFRSSSLVLELLATTGIIGIAAFAFLLLTFLKEVLSQKTNWPLLVLAFAMVVAVVTLPFSPILQISFFLLLALITVILRYENKEKNKFFDVEVQLVTLKKGLISFDIPAHVGTESGKNRLLPIIFSFILLVMVGFIGVWGLNYLRSDLSFRRSLLAFANNDGLQTYQEQISSINTFPYRDLYHRVFSQTNLALANSLLSQQPRDSSPSAQTQQTVTRLIQQSINSGRTAPTLSPQTSLNWQNLSSIYRSLIGFGQNAEQFAILAQQQSVLLDPNNPQQYLILGGIYYQLGAWDNAQNQFQIAVNLKPDFANAHYNLGHALQQKGDIRNAKNEYEIVKTLVLNDQTSLNQITEELKALSQTPESKTPGLTQVNESEQPLGISTPSSSLPPRTPPVKIPPPTIATQSSNK